MILTNEIQGGYTMKKMKKLFCALLVMLTAVTMLSEPFQVEVQAAKTINANTNWKKAPTIKKKGTYNVNDKKNDGYIRFVAPKSGTYTIYVYNNRDWGKSSAVSQNLGHYNVYKKKSSSGYSWLYSQTLKTNYGKTSAFNIVSLKWYNRFYKAKKKTAGSYLYNRYAKIKLKKGESAYLRAFWTGGKHQYTVKIK